MEYIVSKGWRELNHSANIQYLGKEEMLEYLINIFKPRRTTVLTILSVEAVKSHIRNYNSLQDFFKSEDLTLNVNKEVFEYLDRLKSFL